MNEELQALENSVSQILESLRGTLERGQRLNPQVEAQTTNLLNQAAARIAQLRQEITTTAPTPEIPSGADLLWILSGSNPEAFVSYLRTMPDPALNALARNPTQLAYVISELERRVTTPTGEVADGVPRADLQSSNIYGYKYDPRSKKMWVKFQGNDGVGEGPVYEYEGVPAQIFKLFKAGAIPAKTTGQNRWGRWWTSKVPSLGASMVQLIKQGGYPYARVA